MKKDEKEEMHHAAKPEWKAAKSEWIELKDYRHCLHGCYRDSYHYCLCLRNSPCNGERLGGSLIVHWKRHLLYQRPYLRMLFHSFFFILCFFCLTFLNTVFSLSGLDNDRVLVRLVLRWSYEKVMKESNSRQVLFIQQHYFLYRCTLGFLWRSAHASFRKVVPRACYVSRFHVDNWVIRLVTIIRLLLDTMGVINTIWKLFRKQFLLRTVGQGQYWLGQLLTKMSAGQERESRGWGRAVPSERQSCIRPCFFFKLIREHWSLTMARCL